MKNFLARIPLVRLIVPFIAGIILSYVWRFTIGISIAFPLIFCCIILLLLQRKILQHSFRWLGLDGLLISFSLFVFGILLTSLELNTGGSNFRNECENIKAIHIRLLNDPIVKEKSVKLIAEIRSWKDSADWNVANEKILIYLARESAAEKLQYGDELLLHAFSKEIPGPKNPEEFDYRSWLERQGVRIQAYGKSGTWKLTSRGNGNWFKSVALDLRRFYLGKLQSYGLSGSAFGVAAALLLGASDHLDPGTIQSYSASGTLHVLSVSGMHVALVYVVLLKLLLPLEKRRRGKFASVMLQLIFIWFYATLTGLCPSVLRSVTMLTVVIAGRAFNRNAHILNSLSASALILLIFDPLLLFDIGFQLSYLAVGGIVTFQPRLERIWEPNLDTFFGKISAHVWTLISVTIVAQLFTFPLGLYYFQQFPTYFLISNLLVIPLSTIVMYAGLVFLLLSPVVFIAKPLAIIFTVLIELLNAVVGGIEHLPDAVLYSGKWERLELFFLYLFIISILVFIIRKKKRMLQFGLSALFVLLLTIGCKDRKLLSQEKLIFFDVRNSTAIGIISGNEFVMIADTTLMKTSGDVDYHIEPFLKANKLEMDEVFFLQDTGIFRNNFVHVGKNFLSTCGKRIVIVDNDFDYKTMFDCDILLLKDNTKADLDVLVKQLKPELVICDGSDGKFRIEKWKTICSKNKLGFYDVNEGAWVMEK